MSQPPPVLGLTLAFFHSFVDDHGGRDCFQGLTTLDVCLRFVKPSTIASQLSLVDHVLSQPRGHEYAKPAQWLISHSWSYQFLDVVDAIDGFCQEQELSPDTSFWFCLFANNQHAIGELSSMFGHFLQAFRSALEFTGKMVMVLSPWHDPETLKRTWCVYEVYLSIVLNARFEVAMGTTQKLEFLADIKKPKSILRMLGQINSSNSITTEPSDRDRIFQLIEDQVGFAKLDRMVFDVLQGWIMQSLDKQIDVAATPQERFEWTFTKAMKLSEDAKNDEACAGFQLCVDIFKTSLSPSFWQGWEAQLFVGVSHAKQHHVRETWAPLCDEALSKLRGFVGRDHPVLYRALLNVGDAYCWNGDIDRGMPLLAEASALAQEFHGAHERIDSTHRIGMYHISQRKLTEAEAKLRLAYDGHCDLYGPVHSETMNCRGNLAVCCLLQGRFREAEALMAVNLKEHHRTRQGLHLDALALSLNVGVVQRLLGQYELAKKTMRNSLDGFEREGYLMNALHARRQLAFLKFCQGDVVGAKTCLEAVQDAYLETLAPSHPSCQNILLQLYPVSLEMGTEFKVVQLLEAFQQRLSAANISNETWTNYACHKCYKPIDGDLAVCKQCTRHSVMFCRGCLSGPNTTLVCGHNDGPWDVIPHPTRYLRDRKTLLLAQPRLTEQLGAEDDGQARLPRTFLLLGTTIAAGIVLLLQHRRGNLD